MAKVQVFTNSSSEMSPALAAEFGVIVIPDVVVFSPEEQYLNNVEIDPPAFFQKLQGRKKLPTTSHPNIAQYMDAFSTAGDCDEILFVGLTSKMSGSFSTACTAIRMLQEQGFATPITAYDSLQNCYALCMMALEAARMARAALRWRRSPRGLDVLRGQDRRLFCGGVDGEFPQSGQGGGHPGAGGRSAERQADPDVPRRHRAGRGHRARLCVGGGQYPGPLPQAGAVRRGGLSLPRGPEALAAQVKERLLAIGPDAKVRVEWIGAIIGAYTGAGCIGLAFHER